MSSRTYKRADAASELLSALKCVIEERSAVYVAVPITSGIRLWDFASRVKVTNLEQISRKYPVEYRNQILFPNVRDAASLVKKVRSKFKTPVIDPSQLVVPRWSQRMYRAFWTSVIKTQVSSIILANGWQYSVGCVREFETAVQEELLIFDAELKRMSWAKGLELLQSAVAQGSSYGIDGRYLDETIAHLLAR